jgi:hypothetical protein
MFFEELHSRFGQHWIDRFASALNTILPRYNSKLRHPTCEAVEALHLSDGNWRMENNMCKPMTPPTEPRPKTTVERRSGYGGRPPIDRQGMAPSAYRVGMRSTDRRAPSRIVSTRTSSAMRYNKQSLLGRHYILSSLLAWLYLRRGGVSATLAVFKGLHLAPRIPN